MKRFFSGKQIAKLVCLLMFTVGILFISGGNVAYATQADSDLTGDSERTTMINEPGSAQTPDELSELNIDDTLNITFKNGNGQINGALRILIILTLIALAPILIIMLTCFVRIIIVLHFTRAALNTQSAPPNQVLLGLALFLTFFIMNPTITQVYTQAVVPFEAGEIDQKEALEKGLEPIRKFMYGQTQIRDADMFMEIARLDWDGSLEGIPTYVLIPSFIVSELRTAFMIGFMIYIPFIVIDMVVASTLMGMGMMMLPPTTISMPFKILLFVMADGWNLVIGNLVKTFY